MIETETEGKSMKDQNAINISGIHLTRNHTNIIFLLRKERLFLVKSVFCN